MSPVEFDNEDFSDILRKDSRYDSRAYDLVLAVIREASEKAQGHVTGRELLEEFSDFTLDAYGPMSYAVLKEFGLNDCSDVGEVVFNLYEGKRIGKTDQDSKDDFKDGYDFETEFLGPYA